MTVGLFTSSAIKRTERSGRLSFRRRGKLFNNTMRFLLRRNDKTFIDIWNPMFI